MVSIMCNVTNTVWIVRWSLVLLLAMTPGAHAQLIIRPDTGPAKPERIDNAAVKGYQLELLDQAWQAATSYPINPHIKNRGRSEEQVVIGAVKLGRLQQAWDLADKVVNWRRGACYAEIAHALIEQDDTTHVDYFLQQALRFSKDPNQGWRHDRVKARVAQARVLMGQADQADGLVSDEDLSAEGGLVGARAEVAEDKDYDALVAQCDKLVATEGYEAILGALWAYADLYDRYYQEPSRRAELKQKMVQAWEPMPAIRRFEVLLRLTDAALSHEDKDTASALVDEADALRTGFSWPLDYHLRLYADVAQMRVKLGQHERAGELLDEAMPIFEKGQDRLENFYRAGALRPIAESYAKLGDTEQALQIYSRVIELGAVNPNLRPRISDITESCVSMAVHGIEPSDELFETIRNIVSGLGDK